MKDLRSLNRSKSNIRIKVCAVIICLLMFPMLTGADLLDVGIKGIGDKPLVDLSELIKTGGSFMPNDNIYDNESDDASDPNVPADSEASADTLPGTENSSDTYVKPLRIKLTGRDIYMDGAKITGEKTIRTRLEYCRKNNIQVEVDDSYAEFYTRKTVYALIDEAGVTPVPYTDTDKK